MPKDQHEKYMSIALNLAKKAEGMTSPNPLVGAVLVRNGLIIGKGYHKKAGLPHAEIEAFKDARKKGKEIKGATLYVSLEPCCHKDKRTPPCVDAIIENGIKRVIVGMPDPNPKVRGNGVEMLREKGIDVVAGVLEEKLKKMNEDFSKYITTGKPFVTLKLAATLDGKIATRTGNSKWIGSDKQREYAHRLRNRSDAVMVGIETVLKDNPRLNVRLNKKTARQPVPVVLDRRLRTPLSSNLLKIHDEVIIFTARPADRNKRHRLENAGAKVIETGTDRDGLLDMRKAVQVLGKHEVTNLLIEGGSKVAAKALKSRIVDKIVFFYAPRIIGADGVSMIGGLGVSSVQKSLGIERVEIKRLGGGEFMIEGYIDRAAKKISDRLK